MESHSVLLDLFVLFAAAKIAGELFEAVHQPAVVGELLAGVLVGPHVLGWVRSEGDVLGAVAQLGVIILLFRAGLETRLGDLRRVGRSAVTVGVLGEVLGFGAGLGVMLALGYRGDTAFFGAAAVVATSVGIAARVLSDLGALRTGVGRTVLGAAVVDDILAIVALAVLAAAVTGDVSSVAVVVTVLEVVAFLAIVLLAGPRVTRRLSALVRLPGLPDSPFLIAVLLTLGLAALSETIGLAAIIGAFLAGLIFEFRRAEVSTQVEPVAELLVPFFFAVTGSRLDPRVLADLPVLGLTAALVVVAVATKVAAGWLGARRLGSREALTVGVALIPRGEVSLIVASLALSLGVFDPDLYGAVVALTVITAVITAPLLAPMINRVERREEPPEG
jgi:Kef-type K+ transport system membrane component KefB